MRRVTAIALVIAAALWIVACGESTTPTGATTAAPQTQTFSPAAGGEGNQGTSQGATVNIVDAGFTRSDEGGTSAITYGIVLENTSATDDALDVAVTANFLNPSGTIVQTEGDTIHVIPAGTTYYLDGSLFPDKADKTTKLETTVAVGASAAAVYVLPEISDVRMSWGQFKDLHVRGVVTNPYTEPIPVLSAGANVVCFDASGKVVGGGYGFPDNPIPPGAKIAFDAFGGFYGLTQGDVHSVKVTFGNGSLLR